MIVHDSGWEREPPTLIAAAHNETAKTPRSQSFREGIS